ncbi:chemotaxis protein CheB [Desulfomonile tiedjei]|uniref:Methylase of chemotaxis methyl-accepting protein n=1 Tax=Desulfomonile tiedjei (strain ATCC 49306 / DSM 6799 / DCB-1) TaxID=706587 RepID=I4C579_DESTA|nr:chemotaxis protein CheB [Desulfomonile tiedjei]AFM24720.1 methylase of chemotaxis methyl-accepting protein [Desulfomonile tiedjei DSM 6799]
MAKKKSADGKEGQKHKLQGTSEGIKPANQKVLIESQSRQRDRQTLRVVGIGASAGGLEAFEHFFTNLPPDTGLSFVLVQHLDPTHKSILTDLIKKYTRMEVREVTDGTVIEANYVYVIPPNKDMAILNGTLYLMDPSSPRGLRQPIDFFFRSLAEDLKEQAIAIVLSGTGSEGTLGIRAIKGEGGMVMVQDPGTARYDGMPRSAVATGLVDYVVSPDKMPHHLLAYVRHAPGAIPTADVEPTGEDGNIVQKILILVRARTHHDFTHYKKNTIIRRIERRMAVHQLLKKQDYLRFLQDDPLEVKTLFKELLIGVTNFFREPDAFEALQKKALPKILNGDSQYMRIWVPACSTGEEAYSIAMLVQEYAAEAKIDFHLQIFATDIDEEAIEKARLGVYPLSIAADVNPKRLERFFIKEENQFRIKKELREMIVFAFQNVISDPPFSKLDLISCRNLLIYMNTELQKRLIHLFHYALKSDGFLFLGASESVGSYSTLFTMADRKWKLYQRKDTATMAALQPNLQFRESSELPEIKTELRLTKATFRDIAEKALLEAYHAAGVVTDEKLDAIYFYGSTARYLSPASGEASFNLLKMAREELRFELANAVRRAQTENKTVVRPGLRLKSKQGSEAVNLIVRPVLAPSNRHLLLILFEEATYAKGTKESEDVPLPQDESDVQARNRELEHELASAKEYLQTTIEELETSNEELKSTNEELQSANEELQSTNEELETSKEEQQSVNEELATVNSELQQKIEELSKVNDDMNNLLASTQVGTIFLDTDMNVLRFTPAVTELINLIQSDIGRPLAHIVSNLNYDRIVEDSRRVLESLIPRTREVQTKDGRWFVMRMQPYRTTENVIEGVVLTFVEITFQKQQMAENVLCESIMNMAREIFLVLDERLTVTSANGQFYEAFAVRKEDTIGRRLYDLGNRQWDIPDLRQLLEKIIPEHKEVKGFEVEHEFESIGRRKMSLDAKQIDADGDKPRLILLVIQDITDRP